MRNILSILVLLANTQAFAGGAICGKYTANLAKSGKKITILTHADDYAPGAGYTDVGTSISGAVNASCEKFYNAEAKICGLKIVNVKLVSDSDCWE